MHHFEEKKRAIYMFIFFMKYFFHDVVIVCIYMFPMQFIYGKTLLSLLIILL
jgi:hypothetical protein